MMLFSDVVFSTESIVVVSALLTTLTGATVYIFKLLIKSKDDQIALKEKEAEREATANRQLITMQMANQATTNLEIVAAQYLAALGRPVVEPIVPVVPKHTSPTTKVQREEAELQTMQARITAATLALDLPARKATAMESVEDAAFRIGMILTEEQKIKMIAADVKAKEVIDAINNHE